MRDTLVRTNTNTTNLANGSVYIIDTALADLSLSGQGLYQGAWLAFSSSAFEYRVATFNTGTGALLSQANSVATIFNAGTEYELHKILPPSEKNLALDDVIQRVRVNREVGIPSVDGLTIYTLDGAASPNLVETVLDCYVFTNPAGSLDRGKAGLSSWQVVSTGSGTELRVSPALGASQQLVIDAILAITLGAADTATINLPDERWVLAGAAAKAWDMVLQRAPGQNRGQYEQNRNEAARQFTRLSSRHQPQIDRSLTGALDDPF